MSPALGLRKASTMLGSIMMSPGGGLTTLIPGLGLGTILALNVPFGGVLLVVRCDSKYCGNNLGDPVVLSLLKFSFSSLKSLESR